MTDVYSKPNDARFQDIEGAVFGKLKVIKFAGKKKGKYLWQCLCSCGKSEVVRGSDCNTRLFMLG